MIDHNTVAFVTGTERGLGEKFVEVLLQRGVRKVYAASRNAETHQAFLSDPRVVPILLDVTDAAQVRAAGEACADVTLLINNAGVNTETGAIADTQPANARLEMEVNYFGTISMANAFAPHLIANRGAMVNILSILARVALPVMVTLSASKAAALRLTEGLDAALTPHGARAFAVLPGAIDTDMSRGYDGEKMTTADVVNSTFDAMAVGHREIYIGEMARGLAAGLAADRAGVHAQLIV